jgi:hypothetical protein
MNWQVARRTSVEPHPLLRQGPVGRSPSTDYRTSPLPHPASHRILPLEGRVGEWADAASKYALSRISKQTLSAEGCVAAWRIGVIAWCVIPAEYE